MSINAIPGTAKASTMQALAGTRRRRTRLILLGYALVAPAVIWRLAIAIYPFLNTILQSFTNTSPLAGTSRFIGLGNYVRMFHDPVVMQSLSFTFLFTIVSTAAQLVYALGIALLLNRAFRGRGFVRAINLLPWAMPAIVIATASQWMFNSQFGMIDDLIARVLPFRPIWLADPTLARGVVILLDVWKNAPWAAILLLAGLQNVPRELYEAAKVDGASAWRTFYSVVLPMLAPLIFTLLIFISAYRVLAFDLIYGLTQGGPGNATTLLSYQIYQLAFNGLYYGYGSTVAVFAFLIVLTMSLIFFLFMRQSERAL
ncbi:MAG TPA: sugar ABC transporter permease [Ktedonosporobacter sp.]|nr:sugar ABC transporter permease [Ktedonosporobacter sp.]